MHYVQHWVFDEINIVLEWEIAHMCYIMLALHEHTCATHF